MELSIIAIGDELLIGQVTDTNSGWIARNVNPLGWRVKSTRVIGDDATQIREAIESAFSETDLVLTTGGLGPTKDDITKQTLMEIFGGEMIHDKATEANVLEVVEKRHLRINPLTLAQADVPSSCRVIQNKVGTAPIMWFEKDGKVLISLPGVPFETETMMTQEVIPQIKQRFCSEDSIEHRTFVVIGYAESALAIKLEEFENTIPDNIKLAYLPKPGIIRLRLTGTSKDGAELSRQLNALTKSLTDVLGDAIVSYEDKPIEAIVGDELRRRGMTMATAESCTGGNIAHTVTLIAGSSDYYKGTVVSYSNEIKQNVLGVKTETLAENGAVSEPTVREMVEGVAKVMNVDCAIATSGIAGPAGGSPEKPVGTVWMAVKVGERVETECKHFPGSRSRVIERATMTALINLLKLLKNS